MFDSSYLGKLEKAHSDFLSNTGTPEQYVRQEVYESWIRSRDHEASAEKAISRQLSYERLSTHIEQNQLLYDIAKPFLESLYNFLKGSGFMCILAEKSGYVLDIIGDSDIIDIASHQSIPLVIGSNRSERVMGTNAIGTPLITKKPIQLYAYEHYIGLSSNWVCSGAPILFDDEVLGVVCISGRCENVHSHTLGMVVSAASAIAKQISLENTKNHLQTAIDHLRSGVLLLDTGYRISYVNSETIHTLNYSTTELLNHYYRDFFPDLHLEKMTSDKFDLETTVIGSNRPLKCFVNIKRVKHKYASAPDTILLSFRTADIVQKMVNAYIGSQAHFTLDNIIGECDAITRVKNLAQKVAPSSTNVLILGESGTGKELFAQSIHNASPYCKGPFIAINCGAIPKDLIESELFGYEAGTFTGAKKEGKAGKFELANNGTIFLDEIGDMPYEVQVRLLRVLQDKAVTRIGGKKEIPLNVRVIAATNQNLEACIENKTFRADLYYRLNVFSLHIPPLRERGNDIELLVKYFLKNYQNPNYQPITTINDDVMEIFYYYNWPGNIRELENVIERVCILTTNGILSKDVLPSALVKKCEAHLSDKSPAEIPEEKMSTFPLEPSTVKEFATVSENEKDLIIKHLTQCSGNISKASESLGMNRRTLYRKITKYNIDPDSYR